MKDYIKDAIADFGESITRSATSPAKKNLFKIDEESGPLTNKDKETFHSIVAKLLYASKRGRLDIQLPIAFLCTRVSCSTEKDWSKLERVLEYLRGTLDEFLTLGAGDLYHENLGRCVIRSARRHEEPHGRRGIFWLRLRYEQILQTKVKHEKLDGSGTRRRKRLPTLPYLGKVLPRSTRVQAQREHFLSRQSEHD